MPRPIKESLDSIERVGGKLTYKDFHDFLKVVANSFPSGTEEYQFLTDLLMNKKTDVSFVRTLFSLMEEAPRISDSEPDGFSWELQSPTETGKVIFKKIDELDPQSARDLYEFMSYVFMNYSQKDLEEESPFAGEKDTLKGEGEEELPEVLVEPKDVAPEPPKPQVPFLKQAGVKSSLKLAPSSPAGFLKSSVTIKNVATFPDFLEFFPTGLGLTADDFWKFLRTGPIVTVEASNGAKLAWHKDIGFVNEQDDVLTLDEVQQFLGSDDYNDLARQLPDAVPPSLTAAPPPERPSVPEDMPVEGAPETGPVQEAEEYLRSIGIDPASVIKSSSPFDPPKTPTYDKTLRQATEAKIKKLQTLLHEGSIVRAVSKVENHPGARQARAGAILEMKFNDGNLPASYATVLWSDGTRSEIPMNNITQILFNSLKETAPALVLVSSYREKNGQASFVLTAFAASKRPNTYTQLYSGKAEMSKEALKSASISTKTRLYSGKKLQSFLSSLGALEGELVQASRTNFSRTFINESAAVIIKSGPYGMFAVKTPVVYVKNAKAYTLFKKIGSSYVSSSGHRFKAILAARYSKPQYLMVAQSVPEFFKTKGAITCNAQAVIERTQFIIQRKAVKAAFIRQKKATVLASKQHKEALILIEQAKAETAKQTLVAQNQTKIATVLGERIVENRKTPDITPNEISKAAVSQARTDRLAKRMGAF